jgi:hypothetical protein
MDSGKCEEDEKMPKKHKQMIRKLLLLLLLFTNIKAVTQLNIKLQISIRKDRATLVYEEITE